MKRIILLLALCCLLAGCSAPQQETPVETGAPVQYFVCPVDNYEKSCVVSSDGRIVVPLSAKSKEVAKNAQGEFCYILTSETVRTGTKEFVSDLEILDGQGSTLLSVSLPLHAQEEDFVIGAYPVNLGAPVERLRFSVRGENGTSIYDGQANEILQLGEYVYIVGGNEYLFVVEDESGTRLYDLDGQPIETEREYAHMGYYGGINESLCFTLAYAGNNDGNLCDLFSPDGKVLLRGLRDITNITEDYIICTRGFSCGMMDLEGNWIAEESIFTGLED